MKEQQKKELKQKFEELKNFIQSLEGDNRSKAIAVTNLETTSMWAARSLYSDEEIKKH
ncbi:Acb2/Tad1 domain-containing protein [Ornithobacterium rhinotracheale]|uniref:Acb2/Tad1 domain-containing protein n=1 Tax=Ornithobacterium rhinotracheale TaxID=28251 RepID=UPI003FA4CFE7